MITIRKVVTALGVTATVVVLGVTATASASSPVFTPPTPPAGSAAPAPGSAPGAAHPALAGGAAPAYFQTPQPELHFVSVTPCRVADTRLGGGRLTHDVPRSFYVAGTFGFAPQGGKSGGCGVPVGAVSVATNVTTTNMAGPGNLTGYATGTPTPLSNFLSLDPASDTTANPILPLANTAGQQLTIKAHGSNTDVVIDVTGYYTQQIDALIYTGGGSSGVYSGSPRVKTVTHIAAGVAQVVVDRDVTNCTVSASSFVGAGLYANASTLNGSTVTVYAWYLNSTTHLPVLVDSYVYLVISC